MLIANIICQCRYTHVNSVRVCLTQYAYVYVCVFARVCVCVSSLSSSLIMMIIIIIIIIDYDHHHYHHHNIVAIIDYDHHFHYDLCACVWERGRQKKKKEKKETGKKGGARGRERDREIERQRDSYMCVCRSLIVHIWTICWIRRYGNYTTFVKKCSNVQYNVLQCRELRPNKHFTNIAFV